jgi:hypothetical protein
VNRFLAWLRAFFAPTVPPLLPPRGRDDTPAPAAFRWCAACRELHPFGVGACPVTRAVRLVRCPICATVYEAGVPHECPLPWLG